jgi:hypothetical protein
MQRDVRHARHAKRFLMATLLSVACMTLLPASGQAQSTPAQPSDRPADSQSPSISEQKLDAVATAMTNVASIKNDYQQKIQQTAPSDRQRLADEGNNALAQAITEQGLSLDEYSSILVVAQNDPVVRQKILQRIKPTTP